MKIIITGATGMVGEGVLLVCLANPGVTEVLSVSRKPLHLRHAKLKALVIKDFAEIKYREEELSDYDACFFCAGVSSIGETEDSFTRKTFDFVVPFAQALSEINSGITFVYVSGSGTDSSEQGNVMWARVKGRTENALTRIGFKAVYNFRPAMMRPVKGQQNIRWFMKVLSATYPFFSRILPGYTCTLDEVGRAMMTCVAKGYTKSNIEVEDIKRLARS